MMEFLSTVNKSEIIFDGIHAYAKGNTKVIVDVHGLSWDFYSSDFYKKFCHLLPENGIDFIAGETRGAHKIKNFQKTDGDFEVTGGALEAFEDCLEDIDSWITKAEELGYSEIYLSGYSMGSSKAAYYSKTKDNRIKGLIFYSPYDVHGLLWEPDEKARHERNLSEAKNLIVAGKPTQFLTEKLWGVDMFSAKTYLSLFDNKNAQIFNYFDSSLGYDVLNQINIPVLAFTGTEDFGIIAAVDVQKAMNILERELKASPKKKTIIMKDAEHSFNGCAEEMVEEIVEFLEN